MTPALSAYRYALLVPGGPVSCNTFGIEVTDPTLAARCIGNLDPQHGQYASAAVSAIEAAKDMWLPRPGVTLATIRPDSDALGAMAVMAWRASGLPIREDITDRIAKIGRMDRHDRGPWPGPRALDPMEEDWPGEALSALSAVCFDRTLSLSQRVGHVSGWLAMGRVSDTHLGAALAQRKALAESLSSGETRVEAAGDGIALVTSVARGALQLGYRLAKLVLATNPCFHFPDGSRGTKHTIAAWGGCGLEDVKSCLAGHEPGWGGSPGILGSPQGAPSKMTQDEVLTMVRAGVRQGAA